MPHSVDRVVRTTSLFVLWTVATAAGGPLAAPEIDSTTGACALTWLAGAMLVVRGRRRSTPLKSPIDYQR
jgi:hypothetical protein